MLKQKAFTLIELLAVVAIVGTLSAFVFVQTNNALNSGKDAKRKSDVVLLASGVASYLSESVSLPVSNSCSINNGCSTEINQIFEIQLGTLPTDPDSGSSYKYESDGTDCTISAILSTGDTYQYSCSTDEVTSGTPTSGECGTANNQNFYTQPTSNFCSDGTMPTISGSGPWTWTCPGTYLGSDVDCVANLKIDGYCGSASGTVFSSIPSTNLCDYGNASLVSGEGPWIWNCEGLYDGITASCATATYTVVQFTTVGTSSWTVPTGVTSIEYLVVAGGGGGAGNDGGGGGGGGVLTGTLSVTSGSSVSITVGAGGSGGSHSGTNGNLSSFSSVSAIGGGGGGVGYGSESGSLGGSGGGGGGAGVGGAGTSGQGNAGGAGKTTTSSIYFVGGGGGGAGSVGSNALYPAWNTIGGNGGDGIESLITGSSVYYAGGGGGAASYNIGTAGGIGGIGGGGDGGYGGRPGNNGISNTGGGGGGGSGSGNICGSCGYSGGSGGSGIVIVKYINY